MHAHHTPLWRLPLPLRCIPCADDDASKAVIRAVCLILDAFHFPLPADIEDPDFEPAPPAATGAAASAAKAAVAKAPAAAAAAEGEEADAGAEAAADEEDDDEEGDEDMPPAKASASAAVSALNAAPPGEVYRMLAKRAVPELQRIMVTKDAVRAPVALAGGWAGGRMGELCAPPRRYI